MTLQDMLNTIPISAEALEDARLKREEKLRRKVSSYFHCAIPDWTGSGGMVHFWINDDGSFECEDSRIDDAMIREGIKRFAKNW